jgi:hypothetical protein
MEAGFRLWALGLAIIAYFGQTTSFRLCFDVAKKKKVKRFRAVTAVKELARERVGAPPAGQVIKNKKEREEKHKPTLGRLLSGE